MVDKLMKDTLRSLKQELASLKRRTAEVERAIRVVEPLVDGDQEPQKRPRGAIKPRYIGEPHELRQAIIEVLKASNHDGLLTKEIHKRTRTQYSGAAVAGELRKMEKEGLAKATTKRPYIWTLTPKAMRIHVPEGEIK